MASGRNPLHRKPEPELKQIRDKLEKSSAVAVTDFLADANKVAPAFGGPRDIAEGRRQHMAQGLPSQMPEALRSAVEPKLKQGIVDELPSDLKMSRKRLVLLRLWQKPFQAGWIRKKVVTGRNIVTQYSSIQLAHRQTPSPQYPSQRQLDPWAKPPSVRQKFSLAPAPIAKRVWHVLFAFVASGVMQDQPTAWRGDLDGTGWRGVGLSSLLLFTVL